MGHRYGPRTPSTTRGLRRDSLALSICLRGGASTPHLLVQNSLDPMARYKLGQIETDGGISSLKWAYGSPAKPPLTKFPDVNSAIPAAGDRPNKSARKQGEPTWHAQQTDIPPLTWWPRL
jgi:hypothetical protein